MGNQFRILQLVRTESKGVPATRWKNTVTPSGIVTGSTGSPLVLPGPIFRLLDLLLDTGVHPSSPSSLNFTPATNTPRSIFLSHLKRASQIPSYHGVTGYLRTKGQESVYETCACVITLFYSATCALILSVISHWCLRGVHVLREALVCFFFFFFKKILKKKSFLTLPYGCNISRV